MRADLQPPAPPAAEPDSLTLDQHEAARLTRLSAKTLGRLADAGEPVGRVKVGRRVLYHRATLAAWLEARATGRAAASSGPTQPVH
jgi:excisionase family DNA binding protein